MHAWTTLRPMPATGRATARVAAAVSLLICLTGTAASAAGLEFGKAVPVRAETGNRAVAVTVRSAVLTDRYGDAKAADGRAFLVLATGWENVLPAKVTSENKTLTTAYKIPDLADHVYVLVDGQRVARVHPDAAKLPGHLKTKDFGLPALGDTAGGNLVFDLPRDLAAKAETIELRYYDLTHGHFAVALAGDPDEAAKAKPLSLTQRNQVLEVGAYGVTKEKAVGGRQAPAGTTFAVVDFRAQSRFTVDADATAFDPAAKPGSRVQKAIFVDWTEWRKYAHLVADGEYAYAAEPGGELPEVPRFLPEAMTGGPMVFLVPEGTKSLELRCDFPNAKIGGRTFRPAGLMVAVEGSRPRPAQRPAVATIDDDFFKTEVVGQTAATEFAGIKAKDGGTFVILDVVVRNNARDGEFFQPREQLKLVTEQGAQLPPAEATFAGPRRPTPVVWVPAGERRAFQVAFEAPAALAKPRLAYAGVSMAKTFDLPALGTPAAGRPGVADVGATTRPAVAVGPGTRPAVSTVPPATPPTVVKPKKDVLPVRVAARSPRQAGGLAAAGLSQEQVNAAIDRGARFLWADVQKGLKERGKAEPTREQALYLLALVHADHHRKDPACDAAVRRLLAEANPVTFGTYGAGLYCMLAESYGDAMYLPRVRVAARYLIESQGPGGTWGYNGNRDPKLYVEPPPDLSQPLSIIGGRPLEGPGSDGQELTRVSPREKGEDGDNSVTQYAVLGLHAATRMGLKVPRDTWARAHDGIKARQRPDGGWGYVEDRPYGSMVCAGLGSLTLCRHHLGERDPALDAGVEQGLGWLDAKFSVSQNPDYNDVWLYYYLYGLERVGRILDTEFVGDHEWYPFGAKFLVGKQLPDGSWKHTSQETEPPLPTSFALLFLTRATPTLAVAKRDGPGTLRTEVAEVRGHKVYIVLDQSGTMMEQTDGVPRAQTAREAMAKLVAELPDGTEVAVRAFGHRKSAAEEGADADTELVVPMKPLNTPLNRAALLGKINTIRPRGKTPLSLTLSEATNDLKGQASRKTPVTVVLVTDGGGDNTRPKVPPLTAVEALGKVEGVALYIVGFDVKEPAWRQQLADLSARGRGQYLTADRSAGLLRELRTAVFRKPEEFAVTDAAGKRVVGGPFGQSVQLPAGKYTVSTSLAGMAFAREAWVNAGSTTVARFDGLKVDFSKAATVAPVATPAAPTTAVPATPAGRPKFCVDCGTPLGPTVKFCTKCGKKVEP